MRLAFTLLLLPMVAVAAPVPKKPGYFPIALGTKWEYAKEGEKENAYSVEVTKVTDKDGVKTVETTFTAAGGSKVQTYRVDKDGVSMTHAEGEELSPPRLDLRPDPKGEDKWDSPHEWKKMKYTLGVQVGKEEQVAVPAGKYDALPHAMTFSTRGTDFPTHTSWYAAGVGLVKVTTSGGETFVLLKYTAGK